MTSAANQKLFEGRPVIRFSAVPLDTVGSQFMIDWDYGYKVGARYLNTQFNSLIRVTVPDLIINIPFNVKSGTVTGIKFENNGIEIEVENG